MSDPASWTRIIAHVDMDAFFASVEIRNNPELAGKPVIVGGPVRSRGVVSACSYEARAFGVHSAMPLAQAYRLCPDGVFLTGNLKLYSYVSTELMKILSEFTPLVEPISVDEAFMDITGSIRIHNSAENLARKLKASIKEKLDLTGTVGIAPNKILAKVASRLDKPDGLTVLDQRQFREKFYQKPVTELWGVGGKTADNLKRKGYSTIADLAEERTNTLIAKFGKFGPWLKSVARGEDSSPVHALDNLPEEKSISHETTFMEDSLDLEYLHKALLALSEKVSRRLRKSEFTARTVSIKVRSAAFETITRDKTISGSTSDYRKIYQIALDLLPSKFGDSAPVRLLGVKASNLIKSGSESQLNLFSDDLAGEDQTRSTELLSAIDSVKDKYGDEALGLGSLVSAPEN